MSEMKPAGGCPSRGRRQARCSVTIDLGPLEAGGEGTVRGVRYRELDIGPRSAANTSRFFAPAMFESGNDPR